MALNTHITNVGEKRHAKVTKRGELVVAPLNFSTPIFQNINVAGSAFNFFKPITGQQFVITTVIADADRNIGANGTTVDIYEATGVTETAISSQILKFDMQKQTSKILTGLNIGTSGGKWINAKADDTNVLMTIAGYYAET